MVYRRVVSQSDAKLPVNFIIWSWPSTRVKGPLNDVRSKAARTETESYYLGWTLDKMVRGQKTSLLGYSFGSRIILGALNLSNGGKAMGRSLSTVTTKSGEAISPIKSRVALLASATHNYWLTPGRHHGLAYESIDKLLLLNNSKDRALKVYRFVEKHGSPKALGYTGLASRQALSDAGVRIRQLDVSNVVGHSHDIKLYFCSGSLLREMRTSLLGTVDEEGDD